MASSDDKPTEAAREAISREPEYYKTWLCDPKAGTWATHSTNILAGHSSEDKSRDMINLLEASKTGGVGTGGIRWFSNQVTWPHRSSGILAEQVAEFQASLEEAQPEKRSESA